MQKQIVAAIPSRNEFFELLKVNPGLIIIKLGATWCGPCKKIAPVLEGFFATSPPNVLCCDLDVDECDDLYAMMKSKRMVNGIPVIMCYKKGNTSYIPDDSVTGADPGMLAAFFQRCGVYQSQIENVDDVVDLSKLK